MKLSKTRIGSFSLYTIETGRFRLDGGAMFGVVPKTLWSRQIESDDKNRIPMAMRCLLIKSHETGRVYLVDDGAGTKFDKKYEEIYQIDHEHSNLIDSLKYHGFTPDDVTDLLLSHLHFDHCGGTTYYDDGGSIRHTFPNARYHVTEKHLQMAQNPNVRESASMFKDNIDPIGGWEELHLAGDRPEYEEGLSALIVNGHTIGQQLPKLDSGGKTLVFAADLIPTAVHIPLAWVMGYDVRPLDTLDEKKELLNRAVDENWYLFLEHDAENEVIQVGRENGKFTVRSRLTLDEVGTRDS